MNRTRILTISLFLLLVSIQYVHSLNITTPDIYYSWEPDTISGTTVEDQANSYDGVYTATNVTETTECVVGTCFSIDDTEDDYVDAPPNIANNADFTWSFWFRKNSTSTIDYIFGHTSTGAGGGYWRGAFDADDDLYFILKQDNTNRCQFRNSSDGFDLLDDEWHNLVVVRNISGQTGCDIWQIYIDGVEETETFEGEIDNEVGTASGAITWYNDGTFWGFGVGMMAQTGQENPLNGVMDEFGWWSSTALNAEEISAIWNSGDGCNVLDNPFGCAVGVNDTDPPIFSGYNQNPSNATLNNVAEGVTTNVTITEIGGGEVSYVNLTHSNNGNVYINGSAKDITTLHLPSSNTSTVWSFELDETDYLPATYNLDPEIYLEDVDHSNFTLTGLGRYLSMEFLNVTNTTELNFFEIMDENATATGEIVEYYYCNDQYDFMSNPIGSSECELFSSILNNLGFDHSHGKSKHRILPLGVDTVTGSVGDVKITPTSHILKRGSQFGDLVYYVENRSREGAFYTTNNNGNTWSEWTLGTIDAHIHQVPPNTALNYTYQACDDSGNCGISSERYDLIEIGNIAPNPVSINSPVFNTSYNTTLLVNHTESSSLTGATIINYTYQYKRFSEGLYTFLAVNDHPSTEYDWTISDLPDGLYDFQVIILDDQGLTTTVFTEFYIDNPATIEEIVEEQLTELNDTFSEGVKTMALLFGIFLLAVILFIGIISKLYILWTFGGAMFLTFYIFFGERLIDSGSLFDKSMMWLMLAFSILFMLAGLILQWSVYLGNREKNNPPGMYGSFNYPDY